MGYDPPLSPIPMELPDLSTNPQWDATKVKEFFAQINEWAAGIDAETSDWVDYTPSWTTQLSPQPSLGNGTLQGRWRKTSAHTILFRFVLTVGSTTDCGRGEFRFSLPASVTASSIQQTAGSGFANVVGQGSFPLVGSVNANSQVVALQAPFDRNTTIFAQIRNTGAALLTGDGRPVISGDYTFKTGSIIMFQAEIEVQ